MIEVKWYARGGQGGFTASKIFGYSAALFGGKYAQAFPSFGPERRGAPVYAFNRIDDKPIQNHSQVYDCDYSVVLDPTLLETLDATKGLKPGGAIIINAPSQGVSGAPWNGITVITYDALPVCMSLIGSPFTNTAMMAVLGAASGLADDRSMIEAIKKSMRGPAAEKNANLVSHVYAERLLYVKTEN